MKLELSIPEKPGVLFFLPLLDLIALVFILPMMSQSLRPATGVQVDLVSSEIRLPQHQKVVRLVVDVGGDNLPEFFIENVKVEKSNIFKELDKKREESTAGGATVVRLFIDKNIASGVSSQLVADLSAQGYACELVYKQAN